MEPSPRALKFVPQILLPKYGWAHQLAGNKYSGTEMSFRQTIHGLSRSDRGFKVVVDRNEKKILISFDAGTVDNRHSEWLQSVKDRIDLDELNPQPYWGFNDLFHKAGTKLFNCFGIICFSTFSIISFFSISKSGKANTSGSKLMFALCGGIKTS